jgi:hypothetical protein
MPCGYGLAIFYLKVHLNHKRAKWRPPLFCSVRFIAPQSFEGEAELMRCVAPTHSKVPANTTTSVIYIVYVIWVFIKAFQSAYSVPGYKEHYILCLDSIISILTHFCMLSICIHIFLEPLESDIIYGL